MTFHPLFSALLSPLQNGDGGAGETVDETLTWIQEALDSAKQLLLDHWVNIAIGIAILFFGWIISKMIRGTVGKVMRRAKVDETLISFTTNLVYMASLAFVFIMALGKFGVDTTSFAAVIAAAGLAIGFALQGSLGNFAAGAMIIMLRPFKVGDYVECAGTAGVVEEISVFATTLKTPDNKVVIVPNGAVTGGNIVNYSTKPTRRVDMTMGIGYGDDIKKAKELFEKIVKEHPKVLADPAPQVAVSELADSSVNFVVRPWCNSADYWAVKFELTQQMKLACDENGISIPFPQRDIHIIKGGDDAA